MVAVVVLSFFLLLKKCVDHFKNIQKRATLRLLELNQIPIFYSNSPSEVLFNTFYTSSQHYDTTYVGIKQQLLKNSMKMDSESSILSQHAFMLANYTVLCGLYEAAYEVTTANAVLFSKQHTRTC